MSRSEIFFQEYMAAQKKEAALLRTMKAALDAVCGNRAAEEFVHLTYVPKIDVAVTAVSKAFDRWHTSVNKEFMRERPKSTLFNHLERREDEVFIGNFTRFGAGGANFETKRLGNSFKDGLGEKPEEEELFPLFIKISEALKKRIVKQ